MVRTGGYDLVSLNELNGINEGRLGKLGREWGFEHAKLLRKSPYHIGLLSKHPLRVLARDTGSLTPTPTLTPTLTLSLTPTPTPILTLTP